MSRLLPAVTEPRPIADVRIAGKVYGFHRVLEPLGGILDRAAKPLGGAGVTRVCADCGTPITGRALRCQRHANLARHAEKHTVSDALVRQMLVSASPATVKAALGAAGLTYSLNRLETLRGEMVTAGEAVRLPRGHGADSNRIRAACAVVGVQMPTPTPAPGDVPALGEPETPLESAARRGSEALAGRIADLYAGTAKRLGCSVEVAALRLNYSAAALAKMAGAA